MVPPLRSIPLNSGDARGDTRGDAPWRRAVGGGYDDDERSSVYGSYDETPPGSAPGGDGGEATAGRCARARGRDVSWIFLLPHQISIFILLPYGGELPSVEVF